ncbi:hypothetical protein M877_31510 [Streptomyces niveus NCIMB 11891]|nr:hypothetical protein M877_31510 [Streptomyces niveus NCIMB 11891]
MAHGAAHRSTHGTALHGAALHLALHRTALHLALHGAALHGTGTVLTLRAGAVAGVLTRAGAVSAGAGGKLRGPTGQLGLAHLRGLLLLYRRSRYGGGDGRAGPLLLLRRLTHPLLLLLLLLVLRGGTRRGGQLGAQILVLAEQARQFGLDLV